VRRNQKFANPFYGLLLIAGIAFALTATTYGVMAFREARPPAAEDAAAPPAGHPLLTWMSRHGEFTLMTELVLLALFSFGAIATDDFWQRRNADRKSKPT
jgi:hypothetical protein